MVRARNACSAITFSEVGPSQVRLSNGQCRVTYVNTGARPLMLRQIDSVWHLSIVACLVYNMCLAFMYIELCCFIWNRTSVRTDCFVAFLYGDIGFHDGTSLCSLKECVAWSFNARWVYERDGLQTGEGGPDNPRRRQSMTLAKN